MKIKTERLVIRDFNPYDDKDLFEICHDVDTCIKAGWTPHANIERTQNVIMNYSFVTQTFAIELMGKVIGTVSLYKENFRKETGTYELGYTLNKTYRGNGYMTEAVDAVIRYAFVKKKVPMIFVCHQTDNFESEKLVKKFPFKKEGIIRNYRKMHDGTIIDAVMYSLKLEEYMEEK